MYRFGIGRVDIDGRSNSGSSRLWGYGAALWEDALDGDVDDSSGSAVFVCRAPRFLGRFVPGGASRFTVQYDPNPGSATGFAWRSKRRFNER